MRTDRRLTAATDNSGQTSLANATDPCAGFYTHLYEITSYTTECLSDSVIMENEK